MVELITRRKTPAPNKSHYKTDLIPTGVTLLNCACSGNPLGGYGRGKLVNLIGDSFTGKTLLALTVLAMICYDPQFKDFKFKFDLVEGALDFDLAGMFGRKLVKRLKQDKGFIKSDTIEDFQDNFFHTVKKREPFVYILDSFDALTSKAEIKRMKEMGKPAKPGKKKAGSYKTEKAKGASELFRATSLDLESSEGLLIVVSQTRDNIGNTFVPVTRSGGKALKFYACHEIWLSHMRAIWKGKAIEQGADVLAKVSKNKLTGKKRRVGFPIYEGYGVDDVMANVEFLIEENVWKKETKQTFQSTEIMDIVGTKDTLIKYVEENSLQYELQLLVGDAWQAMEEKHKRKRPGRFE